MMLLQRFCAFIWNVLADLAFLKTKEVRSHSCEPFSFDHRSTDMRLSWIVLVVSINRLLTEHEGGTMEYWPEVVTVRTECSEVRTITTEGQNFPVRPEQARLVSCLLYGTLFLIAKCTSDGLHLKKFVFFIHLRNFGKISIFLASSSSFIVKNDNIHTFFGCFGCKF